MKKFGSIILIALLMLCAFSACGNKVKPVDGTKLILLVQPAQGEGEDKEAQIDEYTFAPDGSLVHTKYSLYDEQGNVYPSGEEKSTYQKAVKLDPKEFKNMMQLAGEADFMTLPDQIETSATEGNFNYITIETASGKHTSGGLEAGSLGPEGYVKLYSAFMTLSTIAGI